VDRVAGRLVAVALGSNLGDRQAHLAYAGSRLERLLINPRFSTVRETEPVGVPDSQSPYLNAVVLGASTASPQDLLAALLAIERERGRERPYLNAPRTLDLDLLLVGDLVVNDPPDLILPHPRLHIRQFVLEPLLELEAIIDPGARWRHPVTGQTVEAMLEALRLSQPSPSTTHQ
jgi:2-amino-4-hydroxy-6-hydroxymethyldihydropteridine diphosphokinase